jgi:hypothetical protein
MELTICEKWTLYCPEPTEEGQWFLDYVLRSPRDAGIHLTAGLNAYQALSELGVKPDTAMEYFGGMGAQSGMIQHFFSVRSHLVLDNSEEAVRHIESNMEGYDVVASCEDSYDPTSYRPADIVGLDFGDLTVWKTREGEKHRELLDRVFAGKPKGVVLTDVACRYLHLHRERYETLLGAGTCADYPTYLEALADRLEEIYGYVMVAGFHHRWSTVMALRPEGVRGEFIPTPESPVGLVVTK